MTRMWKPVLGWIPLVLLVAFLVPTLAKHKHINRKIIMPILQETNSYAVVFDAGSSGSRVHVFSFDSNLDLVPVEEGSDEYEVFLQTKPGLSSYASDPQAAAESLEPLLVKAENAVPEALRSETPVRLGATAGLRSLEGNASAQILEAVRDLFMYNSTLRYEDDSVSILSGAQEGSYMWIAINYLLGNVGNEYEDTVGIVDLGGGSVQMGYAISESAAAIAPNAPEGDDPYVVKLLLKKSNYHIYVHSYLSYGLFAARAQILKVSGNDSSNPCILAGYEGTYTYGDTVYKVSASPSGPSLEKCREAILEVLNVDETCAYDDCTFNGVWNGGGGNGQKNLYLGSLFYDKPAQVGFINSTATSAKVIPKDFKDAAKILCSTTFEDAESKYPGVLDPAFICMDLIYEYTLLVEGFGLQPTQEITVVTSIEYQNSLIQAAWPIGSALEAVSSVESL